MRAIPFRITFVSLFAAATLGAPANAQSVRVPGTGVRLVPPQGFTRAERFAGFQDSGRGASIVVTEIAGPVSEVRRGMTAGGLASRGMDLIESRTVTVGEDQALLLHVSQKAQGVDFFKWMLVGGSAERTFIVVGSFPAEATELSDPIREALLSASWGETRRADLFEGIPFRLDPTPQMRLADRMGNLLIFTESGRVTPNKPDVAILVIGNSLGDAEIRDLEAFSRERLLQTDRLKGVRVRSGGPVSIDSLAGYELIAEGSDAKSGRPVGVYQLMLGDGKTYYIAQGFVTKLRLPDLLPVFRQVTGSFRRTAENSRPQITQ